MAANNQLRHHRRIGQKKGQNKVHQDKGSTAILCGIGGEAPDIAKPHSGTGSGKNKCQTGRKHLFALLHPYIIF